MLHLDDVQLYELSEAGPLLFKDPARLAREARIRIIPSARIGADLGLPAPWVEAAAGTSHADPESVAMYWLGRLAPPAPGARKPSRSRSKLPAETLLDADETARRLFATPAALERLDREGRMPSLRVDGAVRYDAELVEHMAGEADAPEAAEARRVDVRAWARYEYTTAVADRPPVPSPVQPLAGAPTDVPTVPDTPEPAAPAPGAFEIPEDLGLDDVTPLEDVGDGPESTLLDIDGFDTVDE